MGQCHRHHIRIRLIELIESASFLTQNGQSGEYYRATIGKGNGVSEKRKATMAIFTGSTGALYSWFGSKLNQEVLPDT
jgi:hypothetical protein